MRRYARPIIKGLLKDRSGAYKVTGNLTGEFNAWVRSDCPILYHETLAERALSLKKQMYAKHVRLCLKVVEYFTLSRYLFRDYGFRNFLTYLIHEVQVNPLYLGQIRALAAVDGFVGLPATSIRDISRSHFTIQGCQATLRVRNHEGYILLYEVKMKFILSLNQNDWANLATPALFIRPYPHVDHFANPKRWLKGLGVTANGTEMIYFFAPDIYRICVNLVLHNPQEYVPMNTSTNMAVLKNGAKRLYE
ncbi:hypothetical protein OROMI_003331 [Orobanche minor]